MEEHYPRDLLVISFSASPSFEPKDTEALWAEFVKSVPDDVVVEQMPSYGGRAPKACAVKVSGQDRADTVKEAIEKNPNLVFGQVTPLSVDRQLYLEERFGMIPVPPVTSPSRIETGKPATPTTDQGPGPIQRRINAAAPGTRLCSNPESTRNIWSSTSH